MAKCPKCEARKGKRPCPALDSLICPSCCATHRLQTIACPQDCSYLESEFYQQRRRRERANQQGRRFVEALNENFAEGPKRDLVFLLQAEMHYYATHEGRLTNGVVQQALETLKGQSQRVVVAGVSVHPLAPYLKERLERGKPYKEVVERLADRDLASALGALARYVGTLGPDDGCQYQEEIGSFFGALDFEADLDYDPAEDTARETTKRSDGGIILPPGAPA